jgi:aspartate kinase
VDKDQTIICIVGQKITEQQGVLKQLFDSLAEIPIRMVSCGGSANNVSVLVNKQYKEKALNALNEGLFGLK